MTRRVEYVALDEIRAADVNPKQHDIGEICASIIRQGFVEPPVVDERTGKLVAGHGRLEALAAIQKQGTSAPAGIQVLQGRWFAPVVRGWASKDDAAARAYLVSSNRLVELGGWHDEALTRLLAEMAKESPDALIGTGFDVDDAERRLWALEKDQVDMAALDVVPDMRPTKIKAGDVIELGDHRIICGDSTDVTVVSRLMGGEKADICWTDPPWNVAYGQRTKKKRKAIANDDLGDAFAEFISKTATAIAGVLRAGGGAVPCHVDSGVCVGAPRARRGWSSLVEHDHLGQRLAGHRAKRLPPAVRANLVWVARRRTTCRSCCRPQAVRPLVDTSPEGERRAPDDEASRVGASRTHEFIKVGCAGV